MGQNVIILSYEPVCGVYLSNDSEWKILNCELLLLDFYQIVNE